MVYSCLIQTGKGTKQGLGGRMGESPCSITLTTSQNAFAFVLNYRLITTTTAQTCPFTSCSTKLHSSSPLSTALIHPSSTQPSEHVDNTELVVIWEYFLRVSCWCNELAESNIYFSNGVGRGVFPRKRKIWTANILHEVRWLRFQKR